MSDEAAGNLTAKGAERSATLPRTWPARFAPRSEERIELACAACGADWWIHTDLAGYRLRCECGAWVRVPPDPRSPGSMRAALAERALLAPPSPLALAPAALAAAKSEPAPRPKPRRSRAGLQLAGLTLALLLPGAVLLIASGGAGRAAFQPLASLFAGLVVLATGLFSERHTAAGLRGAAPRFFAEALGGAAAAGALALAFDHLLAGAGAGSVPWQALLRDDLGYGPALLLAALCPAVFEELAFRGLLQGRAAALFGRRAGILASSAAFALAHGLSAALPLQLVLGLHLGSLRARGRSLLPCIVEHFAFSALLVLLA